MTTPCPTSYRAATLHHNPACTGCRRKIRANKHAAAVAPVLKSAIVYVVALEHPPSLNQSGFPFDQTTKARRQLFSRNGIELPSSTLNWLQPLSLIFLQAVTIHCLWHSPVSSLTPFNQINFIFLSMPRNWMSQMGRDVTWFRMSIFWQLFYLQFS